MRRQQYQTDRSFFCPLLRTSRTVCSEKIAPALDHPNEMPTYRIFSPLFSTKYLVVSRLSITYQPSFYLGEIFPRHGPKVSHKIVANSYTAVFELHKNTPTSTPQPRFGLTPNKFAPSYSLLFKQRYSAPQLQAPGVFFPNPPPTFTSLLTTQIARVFLILYCLL